MILPKIMKTKMNRYSMLYRPWYDFSPWVVATGSQQIVRPQGWWLLVSFVGRKLTSFALLKNCTLDSALSVGIFSFYWALNFDVKERETHPIAVVYCHVTMCAVQLQYNRLLIVPADCNSASMNFLYCQGPEGEVLEARHWVGHQAARAETTNWG